MRTGDVPVETQSTERVSVTGVLEGGGGDGVSLEGGGRSSVELRWYSY